MGSRRNIRTGFTKRFLFTTEEHFQANDVVAWVDEEEVIQHAAYCIDGDLFFNKNGQTFFNPWKIVHGDELKKEWERYTLRVYRKSLTVDLGVIKYE